jgi:hypothetical protein
MVETTEDVIRAAVNVIVEPLLRMLQDDPHQWSTRPCETCRAIESLTGKPFGCYLYAHRRRMAAQKQPTETP